MSAFDVLSLRFLSFFICLLPFSDPIFQTQLQLPTSSSDHIHHHPPPHLDALGLRPSVGGAVGGGVGGFCVGGFPISLKHLPLDLELFLLLCFFFFFLLSLEAFPVQSGEMKSIQLPGTSRGQSRERSRCWNHRSVSQMPVHTAAARLDQALFSVRRSSVWGEKAEAELPLLVKGWRTGVSYTRQTSLYTSYSAQFKTLTHR